MKQVDETCRESLNIAENRSGLMREGSGSPKNASTIYKYKFEKQKRKQTTKHNIKQHKTHTTQFRDVSLYIQTPDQFQRGRYVSHDLEISFHAVAAWDKNIGGGARVPSVFL